jgi:hypothetical protein
MASKDTLLRDILYFLKNDLSANITDPLNRTNGIGFIMTSYPQRNVKYPVITIKCTNLKAPRSGMQTTLQDITITIEIRIWARNEKEKDTLFNQVMSRLTNIQFTASTGSVANDFHNFDILSGIEIDEEGDGGIKSRILQIKYNFYNL